MAVLPKKNLYSPHLNMATSCYQFTLTFPLILLGKFSNIQKIVERTLQLTPIYPLLDSTMNILLHLLYHKSIYHSTIPLVFLICLVHFQVSWRHPHRSFSQPKSPNPFLPAPSPNLLHSLSCAWTWNTVLVYIYWCGKAEWHRENRRGSEGKYAWVRL